MSSTIPKDRMAAFEKLSYDPALSTGDIGTALEKIGRGCTKILKVEETAFWHFSQDGKTLSCMTFYKTGQKTPAKVKGIPIQKIKEYLTTVKNSLYTVVFDSSPQIKRIASEFLRKDIKASLHVPVYIDGAMSGVVQFNQTKTQREFSLYDRVLACKVAELTANTLQNFGIKGFEKYTPDVTDVLNNTLDHVLKELDLEYGMIRLDEIPVTRGYSSEVEMEFINQYQTSQETSAHTLIVTDIKQAAGSAKRLVEVLKTSGIRSFINAPIQIGMDQVGVIHAASTAAITWKPEAAVLLEQAANHIAGIVNAIWARQDSLKLSGLIQRFQKNAQTLNRLMMFDEAIKAVGKSAAEVLETDMAFIIIRNPDRTLSSPWVNGLNPEVINRIVDIEGAAIESILRYSHEPILFPDVRQSVLPLSLQRHLIERKAGSTRIFPLVYENKVMGAVLGFYKQMRMFTHNERNILSLFANAATLTLQNAWMYNQIEQGYLGLALALAHAEDEREATLEDSSLKSARMAEEIARSLNVSEDEVMSIHWAALLHDIGKKDVPESVLQKNGPLNDNEWELIRRSPETGEKMLVPIPRLQGVAKIIRNFHEHYDGTGYPDRLSGDEIPIGAKVLAITDAYTSMIDERAYRTSRPPQEALREIQRYSGKYFDPVVVDAFNKVAEKFIG